MPPGGLMDKRNSSFLNSQQPLIIAEIGGNHGGSVELAERMVDSAAAAGATVVKFQTYVPERLTSRNAAGFEEFARESLSYDEFRGLAQYCRERDVVFLSTPFDEDSADLLEDLGVPAFKIASGDLTHLALIRHVAAKNKPIFLSTGASTWEDIDRAVEAVRVRSTAELVLLHCIAAYPAPDEEANLRVIPEMERRYGLAVGFSDHTLGIDLALAAVALGAQVIEKHFTTDQTLPGGDNEMSILPEELATLLKTSRRIQTALGKPDRTPTPAEKALLPAIRRSLVLRRDLGTGDVITATDLTAVRPETGIPANQVDRVVGRRLGHPVAAFVPLQWEDLAEASGGKQNSQGKDDSTLRASH